MWSHNTTASAPEKGIIMCTDARIDYSKKTMRKYPQTVSYGVGIPGFILRFFSRKYFPTRNKTCAPLDLLTVGGQFFFF